MAHYKFYIVLYCICRTFQLQVEKVTRKFYRWNFALTVFTAAEWPWLDCHQTVIELESSFLMASQHILGYLVPYMCVEDDYFVERVDKRVKV